MYSESKPNIALEWILPQFIYFYIKVTAALDRKFEDVYFVKFVFLGLQFKFIWLL